MNTQPAPIVGEIVELGSGYSPEVNPALVDQHTQVMPEGTDESRSWAEAMKQITPQPIA